MRFLGFGACLLLLASLVQPTTAAIAREPWAALASNAAANKNALYSPILEREVGAAVAGAPMPADVIAGCNEPGLSDRTRVFATALYVPNGFSVEPAGDSCTVSRGERNSIAGFATFNSAWWPMHSGPAAPTTFFAKGATYHVPMIHLTGLGRLEYVQNTRVVEVNFRDLRYAMLVFPDVTKASTVRAATSSILSRPDPDFANRFVSMNLLRLAIPVFELKTQLRVPFAPSHKFHATMAAFINVHEVGVGKTADWPRLPRHVWVHHGAISSVTFDRPFYFAIVRFDTHSVVLVGYVARPTLNV